MTRYDAEESKDEPSGGTRRSGNTRLPYALCKNNGINLPNDATPRDAWEALRKRTGKTPDAFYKDIEEQGGVNGKTSVIGRNESRKEPTKEAVRYVLPKSDPKEYGISFNKKGEPKQRISISNDYGIDKKKSERERKLSGQRFYLRDKLLTTKSEEEKERLKKQISEVDKEYEKIHSELETERKKRQKEFEKEWEKTLNEVKKPAAKPKKESRIKEHHEKRPASKKSTASKDAATCENGIENAKSEHGLKTAVELFFGGNPNRSIAYVSKTGDSGVLYGEYSEASWEQFMEAFYDGFKAVAAGDDDDEAFDKIKKHIPKS